jgi:hypothetical protein
MKNQNKKQNQNIKIKSISFETTTIRYTKQTTTNKVSPFIPPSKIRGFWDESERIGCLGF